MARVGRKRLGDNLKCSICHIEFYRSPSIQKLWPNATCSRTCAAVLRLRGSHKDCMHCKKTFYARLSQTKQGFAKFCSKRCEKDFQIASLGGVDRRSRTWKVLTRKKWIDDKCARCGSTESLELDHIIPRFAGGPHTKENSQTLCRPCNRRKHLEEDLPIYATIT